MIEIPQLAKRLLLSAVFVPATVYAIFYAPFWAFLVLIEIIILLGLHEYFDLAEKKGFFVNRNLGLVFGALLPLPFYLPGEALILTVAVLCIFLFNFHRSLKEHAIVSTALTLFGLIYVAWFFSFFIKMRFFDHGKWWIFYTILIVKAGDAGAYFIGKAFGVNKFIEHISPNKSIEGSVGGFVTTMVLSMSAKVYLPHVPIMHLIVLGGIVGIFAQLGDLAESLLKRDAGVKDSGQLPGLGGVLDMTDSLLLTAPVVYYYLVVTNGLS